ncbi:MAG: phosphoribulokinase [Rhodospirillales bacterium]
MHSRPVIIGIVGDSGAGKSTMALGLADVLGPDRTLIICSDDYIKYSRKRRGELGITAHDPAANYMDILEQHVALLRRGQPVLKPVYNHNGGVLEPAEYVRPKEFIILEGLLGYATPTLRDAFDVKFFLEPQEPLRLRWKFQRDTQTSGYTLEQVMASLDRLNRDSARFVLPQRACADMVIGFYPSDDSPEETGARLNVRHILRPTLPQIDIAALFDGAADFGFEMELARDVDGRPADALHIFGALEEVEAKSLQDRLWRFVANGRREHPALGAFHDARNVVRHSPPLALSQLLLTHYLLTAASDQHAN